MPTAARADGVPHWGAEPIRSIAQCRRSAKGSAAQSELPECPCISLSRRISAHTRRRGRAANTEGRCPKGRLPRVVGGPFCGWVSGYSEMHRASAVMAENHEGEQELKCDGGHHEEVCRGQVLGVIFEKGSPRLGRRFPVPGHVFGDCCLRHLDSNLQQFPMNAWSTPSRVGEAHLTNQLPNFRG
jgi:hypothetical protein